MDPQKITDLPPPYTLPYDGQQPVLVTGSGVAQAVPPALPPGPLPAPVVTQPQPLQVQLAMVPGVSLSGLPLMNYEPQAAVCAACNESVVTVVRRKNHIKTHFFACAFLIVGCIPCALIPYCTPACRHADHFCPRCDAHLGVYSLDGRYR